MKRSMLHPIKRRLAQLVIPAAALIIAQGAASAQEPTTQYVNWTDSTNRFTFDVPDGWTVGAGVIDVLGTPMPDIYAYAPGDTAVVVATTPATGLYLEPLAETGLTEGETIAVEGLTVTALTFQPPVYFLEDYLEGTLLSGVCDSVTYTASQPYDLDANLLAADVSLECSYPEGKAAGYFYLTMVVEPTNGVGTFWMPNDLYGYLAEPGMEAQAEAALVQLIASLQPTNAPVAQSYTGNNQTTYLQDSTQTHDPAYDSGYDPSYTEPTSPSSDYTSAMQDYYNQQLQTQMISNMMAMQHQTNMMIINNIGGGDYTWEYEWVYRP